MSQDNKINTQKSIVFLYTTNEQNLNYSIIAVKYLGANQNIYKICMLKTTKH